MPQRTPSRGAACASREERAAADAMGAHGRALHTRPSCRRRHCTASRHPPRVRARPAAAAAARCPLDRSSPWAVHTVAKGTRTEGIRTEGTLQAAAGRRGRRGRHGRRAWPPGRSRTERPSGVAWELRGTHRVPVPPGPAVPPAPARPRCVVTLLRASRCPQPGYAPSGLVPGHAPGPAPALKLPGPEAGPGPARRCWHW
mmetsp:Transcript_16311/g.38823  ORF Transcript_16311/g.38823 Transcript_16311/m.38823 type:complete len:200 (-) Transcript_16311:417-1016(-)